MITWGVVSALLSIVLITNNNASFVLAAGFFSKLFAFILGSILGLMGAMIGDAIRKFALPDLFVTNGGIGAIIWSRVFWGIGPQVIGLFIGAALGIGMILHTSDESLKVKGDFLSGCVSSGTSKSICSCAYSKLQENYSDEELVKINMFRAQSLIDEFLKDSTNALKECKN